MKKNVFVSPFTVFLFWGLTTQTSYASETYAYIPNSQIFLLKNVEKTLPINETLSTVSLFEKLNEIQINAWINPRRQIREER
jgi:hypothetical protein